MDKLIEWLKKKIKDNTLNNIVGDAVFRESIYSKKKAFEEVLEFYEGEMI